MNFYIFNSILSSEIIFLGILILTLILYFILMKKNRKIYNLPPGPMGLPFVGYLPFLRKKHHKKLYQLSKKYGNVFSLYLGNTLTVFCNDWASVEEAFNKIETANRPPGTFDAIPNGLGHAGASGKEWVEKRRLTVKTMRDVGLGRTQWEELMKEEVEEIIKNIRDTKGKCTDARNIFLTTFTNNIMTLLFDKRLPTNDSASIFISNTVDYVLERFEVISWANFLPRLSNLLFKMGLYGSKESMQKIHELSTFVEKYVDEKVEIQKDDEKTFIGVYMKEIENQKNNPQTYITKKSLYGDVNVLILGGTETTRTAMVWLMKNISKNLEVQRKVQEELDCVLGRHGKITWSERDKVPYTFSTILESLRLKSMVPINTMRMTSSDIQIQGYDIPKGTTIIANNWALHNDPKYWPEPRTFKPERFITEEKKVNFQPESFMAFSTGRRACPGRIIALMELLEYFITVMQNFTVLPPEEGFIKYDTIYGLTYQATSMMVRFLPREEYSLTSS